MAHVFDLINLRLNINLIRNSFYGHIDNPACLFVFFFYLFRTKTLLHSQHSPVTYVYTIALGLKIQDRPWGPDFHWGPFAISPRHRFWKSDHYFLRYLTRKRMDFSLFDPPLFIQCIFISIFQKCQLFEVWFTDFDW